MKTIEEQKQAALALVSAIIESVKAAGNQGAPGDILYAALMSQGCTLNQFNSLMAGIVNAGLLTKQGDLYFVKL